MGAPNGAIRPHPCGSHNQSLIRNYSQNYLGNQELTMESNVIHPSRNWEPTIKRVIVETGRVMGYTRRKVSQRPRLEHAVLQEIQPVFPCFEGTEVGCILHALCIVRIIFLGGCRQTYRERVRASLSLSLPDRLIAQI